MKKSNLITAVLLVLCVLFSFSPAIAAADSAKQQPVAEISGKVNINTAGVDSLVQLPGVGQKTAERIVSYRQENGNFKSAEDLMNVKGIGQKKFDKLKSLVTAS